jgi:hypothetical protein
LVCFSQLEADGADKDVDIIGGDTQTETSLRVASAAEATERHTKAEVPVMEVPVIDATNIPNEAEIPCQSEV